MKTLNIVLILGLLFGLYLISCESENDINLNDSEVTYTFKSSDYNKMDRGIYKVRFSFCGTKHETSKFDLNQDNGRIWVGIVESNNDSILVE